MKHKKLILPILVTLICTMIVMACSPGSSASRRNCGDNICVNIELATPISLNQPTDVILTIDTDVDMNDLQVHIDTDDPDAVLAQNDWFVDVPANQPLTIMTTVTFVEEQYYLLVAWASFGPGFDSASKGIRVHVTQAGGTLNPPDPHTPGVPAQGDSQTYPSYDPSPIPPQPTAWDRSLLPFFRNR